MTCPECGARLLLVRLDGEWAVCRCPVCWARRKVHITNVPADTPSALPCDAAATQLATPWGQERTGPPPPTH